MADEEKKVSFGFSKTIKKSALPIPPKAETRRVDYIECLDEKAIRVVGEEEKKDEELVIPMLGSKTWCDRIMNKTDADIFEPKTKATENGEHSQVANGSAANGVEPMDVSLIKTEKPDETDGAPKTLEELAASEIIEDLKSKEIKAEPSDMAVPIVEEESLRGKQESTLEDYEQIPIDGFGLAVLRGMGWKPGKGIGKNEKLVAASIPELRPRGMGLGADKLTLQKQTNQPKTKEEEQLKIERGSFVKATSGKHSNNYGQIESFDDDAGRLIVKMALSGESVSLSQNVVQPVTKAEFAKNSKVLNATKYEEYKSKNQGNGNEASNSDGESSDDREAKRRRAEKSNNSGSRKKSKKRSTRHSSDESSDEEHRSRKRRSESESDRESRSKKSKKSKKRSMRHSSDESSDEEHRSRKRRSESESDRESRSKKSKKSKKSHRRDSSSERSSRKSKRKDKEREKERTRERRVESPDRRQHRRHKRSRSRSPRRR